MGKRVCVFCGSSSGNNPQYIEEAKSFGESLHKEGHSLVYGPASVGIMGAVADAILEKGGEARGVIPKSIVDMEVAHEGLTEIEIVDSMHERKQMMYDWSDGFVAIPGGMGTLDEFCEIVTWAQLRYHQKPCYILNVNGFYDHLIAHFKHINKEGFLKDAHLELVKVVDTVDSFMESIG